jgi:hypothetical protein
MAHRDALDGGSSGSWSVETVEAVDLLINNLGHTGQNGIIMSIHIDPPR